MPITSLIIAKIVFCPPEKFYYSQNNETLTEELGMTRKKPEKKE